MANHAFMLLVCKVSKFYMHCVPWVPLKSYFFIYFCIVFLVGTDVAQE